MRALQIGDEIKKIEFGFEATEQKEFNKILLDLLFDFVDAKAGDTQEPEVKKTRAEIRKENIEKITTSITITPDTVLTMFHAGLLEHHGEYGDKTVTTREDARKYLKMYLTDKEAGEKRTYYSAMNFLMGQVIEDEYLDLIGITEMFSSVKPEKKTTAKKTAKVESGVM